MSDSLDENSYNEQLSVEDDGYTLSLRPLGMMMHSKELLSVEGAAEFYSGYLYKTAAKSTLNRDTA